MTESPSKEQVEAARKLVWRADEAAKIREMMEAVDSGKAFSVAVGGLYLTDLCVYMHENTGLEFRRAALKYLHHQVEMMEGPGLA